MCICLKMQDLSLSLLNYLRNISIKFSEKPTKIFLDKSKMCITFSTIDVESSLPTINCCRAAASNAGFGVTSRDQASQSNTYSLGIEKNEYSRGSDFFISALRYPTFPNAAKQNERAARAASPVHASSLSSCGRA